LQTGQNKAVTAWLTSLDKVSTWKWSDTPSQIKAVGDRIVVATADGGSMLRFRTYSTADLLAEQMREKGNATELSEMQRICKDKLNLEVCRVLSKVNSADPSGEDSRLFVAAAPILIANIADFRRVEEFLKVMALFRWAKENGAEYLGDAAGQPHRKTMTPDVVVVGLLGDWIAGGSEPAEWSVECRTFFKNLTVANQVFDRTAEGYAKSRIGFSIGAARQMAISSGISEGCTPPPR
jgi:hypothetical protein